MKKLLLLLLSLVLVLSGCAKEPALTVWHCGEEPLGDPDALRVGLRTTITNFSVLNEQTGKYYGLEVDLSEELARRLGYDKLELVTTHAATRESDLESGRVDVVLAIYTVTDERREVVDFSPAYYQDSEQLVIQKSTRFEELEDLDGMKVAVHTGSTAKASLIDLMLHDGIYETAEEAEERLEFIEISKYEDMFEAIELGEADALVVDGCIAHAYINTERQTLRYLTDVEYAAGTKKGSEMSERVAKAIQEIISDGTMQRIIDKWE